MFMIDIVIGAVTKIYLIVACSVDLDREILMVERSIRNLGREKQ